MHILVLPVADQLALQSTNFLARALQPNHPSHHIVRRHRGPRLQKHTLQSLFGSNRVLRKNLVNGSLPPESYKDTIKSIHTKIVAKAVHRQKPNKVLGGKALEISKSERSLPRAVRTTLTQLRSSYCIKLKSYRARIGKASSPKCPHCNRFEQTTNHLFQCKSFPTQLTTRALWEAPEVVASFLKNHPDFSDLWDSSSASSPPSSSSS